MDRLLEEFIARLEILSDVRNRDRTNFVTFDLEHPDVVPVEGAQKILYAIIASQLEPLSQNGAPLPINLIWINYDSTSVDYKRAWKRRDAVPADGRSSTWIEIFAYSEIFLEPQYFPFDPLLVGAQGPQGERGERGQKGDQGDRGVQGNAGNVGQTGSAGPRGDPGPRGETGATGQRGPTGTAGADGQKGDKGERGEQGPQGIPGTAGARGAQGIQGERGLQGEAGARGNAGSTGLQGARGETGPQGIQGAKGDTGTTLDKFPYDLACQHFGKLVAGFIFCRFVSNRTFTLPGTLSGSTAYANIAPTGNVVISLRKNGTEFGQVRFNAGTKIGSYSGAGATFNSGDLLTFHAPAPADATFADSTYTLKATLVN